MYRALTILFFILTVTAFVLGIITRLPALPLLAGWCVLVSARASTFVSW